MTEPEFAAHEPCWWPDRDHPPRSAIVRLAALSGCCLTTVLEAYRGTPVPPSAVKRIATAANVLEVPVPRRAIDLRKRAPRSTGRPSSVAPLGLADSAAQA